MNRLVLIDGNAILHRAYHAFPKTLTTSTGELTNATYGFAAALLTIFGKLTPSHVIVAFDTKKPTFRHKKYDGYKASRPKMDDELVVQFKRTRELVSVFNIPRFEVEGFEADDVIGTLAFRVTRGVQASDTEVIIVTGDRDAFQLLDEQVKVFFPSRGRTPEKLYTVDIFEKEYEITPRQLIDFKALAGDSSDEIPGVAGIGPKSATELLKKYPSVEEIYAHLDEVKPAWREKLERDKQKAFLSKELAAIRLDVPIQVDMEKSRLTHYDKEKVVDLFLELEFASLVKRLPNDDFEEMVVDALNNEDTISKKNVVSDDQMKLF